MVDNTNTEIVAYTDNLTFNEAYPSTLPMLYNKSYTNAFVNNVYLAFDMRVTDSYISSDSHWVTELRAEPRIYAFLIRQFGSDRITENDALSIVGVCYYVLTPLNVNGGGDGGIDGTYLRIAKADIPTDIVNPFAGNLNVKGEDIFWLYNLGEALTFRAVSFSDILNFEIGGYNLLSLLFSTGFLVYMGWAIVKWVIPL